MTLDESIQLVIVDKLKKGIIDRDMVATGKLLDSVRFEKEQKGSEVTYNIIALDYIEGLEFGIEPGQEPPSIENLKIWIAAKGLDLNPYAVRNSIINQGTTWYRQGGSQVVTSVINEEAFNEVIELSKDEIKNKIVEQWQYLFKKVR